MNSSKYQRELVDFREKITLTFKVGLRQRSTVLTNKDHNPAEAAAWPESFFDEIAPQMTVIIAKVSSIEPTTMVETAVDLVITILNETKFSERKSAQKNREGSVLVVAKQIPEKERISK